MAGSLDKLGEVVQVTTDNGMLTEKFKRLVMKKSMARPIINMAGNVLQVATPLGGATRFVFDRAFKIFTHQ